MVKDTTKSLEHIIIMKCDPPTPAMPTMATGATVLGLYSHIAHSVDKEEGEIPQPFKGTKPKQPEVEGNLKENLKNKDRTHQKPKRQKKLTHTKTLIITITMPQVRVEATDLIMVKAETDNFEGLHHEIEVKDLSIVSISFKIIAIREAHHNKIVLNMATLISPIFRGTRVTLTEAEAVAVDLNISEDAVVVGPIIRITLECISISITHMTNNQNNMVLPAVYAADLTIPPSIAIRTNMT